MPSDDVPKIIIPYLDKLVHTFLFIGFSFLWLASLPRFNQWHLLFYWLISIGFGWLIEIGQGQLQYLGRSFDFVDILADAIGAILGIVIFYIGYIFTFRNTNHSDL